MSTNNGNSASKHEHDAIIASHPEWHGLMDKEIVVKIKAGEADAQAAMLFMGARRMRRYL